MKKTKHHQDHLLRRQKIGIALLVIYWPIIFIITHTPVPDLVKKAHVSDKAIHLVCYMLLAFLFWAAFMPYEKVNWKKKSSYLALIIISLYGLADEYLQTFVNRNANLPDFLANLTGTLIGLALLTFFSFRKALLGAAGITIFIIANLAKTNPAQLMPFGWAFFNLISYSAFTQIWIAVIDKHTQIITASAKWYITGASAPLIFVCVTAAGSLLMQRPYSGMNFILATAAIVLTLLINHLIHTIKSKF